MDFPTLYVTPLWVQVTYRDPVTNELSFNVYKKSSPAILQEVKDMICQELAQHSDVMICQELAQHSDVFSEEKMRDVREMRFDEIGWRHEDGRSAGHRWELWLKNEDGTEDGTNFKVLFFFTSFPYLYSSYSRSISY